MYYNLESFSDKYNIKNPNSICPTAIISRITKNMGFKTNVPDGTTGYYDSNLINKAKSCINILENSNCDFVFLHIKGVDDAGHDKDYNMKIEQLKKVDLMIKYLLDNINCNYILALTGDHSTPVLFGDHSYEKIPFSITSNMSSYKSNCNNFKDILEGFGELGNFNGCEIMSIFQNYEKIYIN